MSAIRKLRRGLNNKRVKTAQAMDAMLRNCDYDFKALHERFGEIFTETFTQKQVEVFAPANSGETGSGVAS